MVSSVGVSIRDNWLLRDMGVDIKQRRERDKSVVRSPRKRPRKNLHAEIREKTRSPYCTEEVERATFFRAVQVHSETEWPGRRS